MKTHLDFLHPNLAGRIEKSQYRQKQDHDRSSRERHFAIGDQVFVRNFQTDGPRWMAAVIVRSRGPVSFDVELEDGQIVHHHIDHVHTRTVPADPFMSDESPLLCLYHNLLPRHLPLVAPPLSAQSLCCTDHLVSRDYLIVTLNLD